MAKKGRKVNVLKKDDAKTRSKIEKALLIEEVEEEIEFTLPDGTKKTQMVKVKRYRAMPNSGRLVDVGEEERIMERAHERAAAMDAVDEEEQWN